jgi:hypothetical protein
MNGVVINVEGSSHDMIWAVVPAFLWRDWGKRQETSLTAASPLAECKSDTLLLGTALSIIKDICYDLEKNSSIFFKLFFASLLLIHSSLLITADVCLLICFIIVSANLRSYILLSSVGTFWNTPALWNKCAAFILRFRTPNSEATGMISTLGRHCGAHYIVWKKQSGFIAPRNWRPNEWKAIRSSK